MTLATTGLTYLGTCWKLKLDLARARILICACAYCVSASASAFPFANLTWDLCRPSLNTVATFKGLYARRSRHLNRSVASRAPLTVSHLVAVPALSTAPPSARLLPQRFPLQVHRPTRLLPVPFRHHHCRTHPRHSRGTWEIAFPDNQLRPKKKPRYPRKPPTLPPPRPDDEAAFNGRNQYFNPRYPIYYASVAVVELSLNFSLSLLHFFGSFFESILPSVFSHCSRVA
ncbi:hypothetical protein CGCA056_v012809 [Colletotrichum aenigma]|uniref:uncharacterized protein n=1 Tax=Colletotrichum aenigma TaxID=1215731 RepID=UPI0018728B2C|nr:uncharacterized protein CGCA056_v012809 [Colletotrichum aenigma]KAF5507431.1 hypothetical protein CGCA056_v012809 [Colletotrichum aenigma]